MYIIQDQDTGYYLSLMSFQHKNKKGENWAYISYTGRCNGMRYYPTQEFADRILEQLEVYNKESGANRKMKVIHIDTNTIAQGNPSMVTFCNSKNKIAS